MENLTEGVKTGRKFDQVLQGARAVFMRDGFDRASVDDIAKEAGVSKATLYSYFPDKRLLFTEVARTVCIRQAEEAVATIDMDQPPSVVLREAAWHMNRFFQSELGRKLFRICVGESDRFPEIGKDFYNSGPRIVEDSLCMYFEKAIGRGELAIDDLPLAAHQFAELCKVELFLRAVLGVQETFTEAETERVINGAVEMFLARYGT